MSAIISPCGAYRYTLHRNIPYEPRWTKPCLFVMLNPSVADAEKDDPTIRRCIGFALAWRCTSLTVVNLFALRATNPKELAKHPDPIGPDNPAHVVEQIEKHSLGVIIAAWGAHKMANSDQTEWLRTILTDANALCLGTTQDGCPRHPLYVPAKTQPIEWGEP